MMDLGLRERPSPRWPVPVVCPVCRGALDDGQGAIVCSGCQSEFGFCDGFVDLALGERFDDATDDDLMLYEEESNADLTRNYLIPLFRRLWPSLLPAPRLLSVGCGTGVDVDLLCEEGFDCVGVDCGRRTVAWPRRGHPDRLFIANGKHLPFPDQSFDGVFCGCVFPHLGVVGDSFRVTERYGEDRLALARELSRVTRPGGFVLVSSPNRFFPMDIFHGRRPGTYRPRPYWPGDPFLLSVGDYRRLFRRAGCDRVTTEAVWGYWGFVRSRHSLKGLLLGLPVRFLFRLVSIRGLGYLRGSPLNPWLVLLAHKGPGASR